MSTKRVSGKPVFDASAVLAILNAEKGAERLIPLQPEAVVSAVNVAEVLAKLINRGVPAQDAIAVMDAMHLRTLPFEPQGAATSTRFVSKGVSLGDRCFLAAASQHGIGWSGDRRLKDVADENGVEIRLFRP